MQSDGGAPDADVLDVLIVGGGPAGLSAALVLGRCCRTVLVCDRGQPRNELSTAVHGYLGLPDASPQRLRDLGRHQAAEYPTVKLRGSDVLEIERDAEGRFRARFADGDEVRARKLLLATGLEEDLPDIPGLARLWGRMAFPCPYCDAWEFRGRRLGALGGGDSAVALCRSLITWSRDLVLFCPTEPPTGPDRDALASAGIRIEERAIREIIQVGEAMSVRVDGDQIGLDALFVSAPQRQRSPLAQNIGCTIGPRGLAETGALQCTNIAGLYIAGDAAGGVQFAIVAAAEGAAAAFAINRELVREAFGIT